MLTPNDIYRIVKDKWVTRHIFDEVVIMPLCKSQEDMQYIYSISNETGSRIWQLLDGRHSVGDIQEILKSEYKGQKEVIERDVLEFVGDIFEAKLIEEVKERPKETRETQYQTPDKKKAYKSPEITKVKMQPEQAVLSCCARNLDNKFLQTANANYCSEYCFGRPPCVPIPGRFSSSGLS